MSDNFHLEAAASAMLLAAPALAEAATTNAVQSATTGKTKTASTEATKNVSVKGDREMRALNALESAGYRQFNTLHANGTDFFVATAMKAGQSCDVTVTPQGRIEARKA